MVHYNNGVFMSTHHGGSLNHNTLQYFLKMMASLCILDQAQQRHIYQIHLVIELIQELIEVQVVERDCM